MAQFDRNGNGNDGKNETDSFFDGPSQDIPPQENPEKPQGGNKEQNVRPSSNGEAAKRKNILKKVIAVVLAVAALVIAFFYGMHCAEYFYDDGLKSLLWFKERVESEYYQDISDEDFWQAAIDGVETILDPYSQYFTSDEYDEVVNSNMGIMDGIGLSFFMNTNKVARVSLSSPVFYAEKDPDQPMNIETGLSLTGIGTQKDSLTNVFDSVTLQEEMAKYKSGDTVYLRFTVETVENEEELAAAQSTVIRVRLSQYVESYVLYAANGKAWMMKYENETDPGVWTDVSEYVSVDEKVSGNTAYLKLVEFNAGAASEFTLALEQFKQDGCETLLFDLRNDGGGSLSVMQNISAHLLKDADSQNEIVLTAKYKNGLVENYTASGNDYNTYFDGKKIYVAANGNTASASEALMGAMISYGTIGYEDIFLTDTPSKDDPSGDGFAKTYGKGIMQSYFYNPSLDEAVKLTTAQIYWPNGNSIHGKGITTEDGEDGKHPTAVFAQSNGVYGDPELDTILSKVS